MYQVYLACPWHPSAGVASSDVVSVVCNTSSISVAVPGMYLLQLQLPFSIDDTAESVKFSSKKQPATLRLQLRILTPGQPAAAAAASAAAPAAAAKHSSGTARKGGKSAQHSQQQKATGGSHNTSSSSGLLLSAARWLDAQGITTLEAAITRKPPPKGWQRPRVTWVGLLLLPLAYIVWLIVRLVQLVVIASAYAWRDAGAGGEHAV